MAPPADHVIWVGSVLGVLGPRDQLTRFANNQLCRLSTRMRQLSELFNPTRAGISEVVIPPVSRFIKHTVAELRLRKRSEEHTSELQSLMRISYAVFCLKKKKKKTQLNKLQITNKKQSNMKH